MNAKDEALEVLARELTAIVSQIVWGRHSPTVMQVLTAISAIEKAQPYLPEAARIAPAGIKEMRARVTAHIDSITKRTKEINL